MLTLLSITNRIDFINNLTKTLCFLDCSEIAPMVASVPSFGDENRKLLGLSQPQYQFFCLFNNIVCAFDLHWYWSYNFDNCCQFNVGLI